MRRWARLAAGLLLVLSLRPPAGAHDFWIEPASFRPGAGTALAIGLRVGENFIGDPVPRNSAAIDRFDLRPGPDGGPVAIAGADGISPAGFVRVDGRRTVLITYDGGGGRLEMPADRFDAYLRQHGLEPALAARAARGEAAMLGRERFHRHAKALLTGAAADPVATRPTGLTLDIVPDRDPTQDPGPLAGRILWRGGPLAGVLVQARRRDDPMRILSARSDDQGRFTLPLDRGGVWLLMAVWMVRGGWFDADDWHSHWSSLTFLRPETP